jgi:hypothetical protein
MFRNEEMARAGDWQEFRDAFNHSENQHYYPIWHRPFRRENAEPDKPQKGCSELGQDQVTTAPLERPCPIPVQGSVLDGEMSL